MSTIYLDNNSTTSPHPVVTNYVCKILSECFGNPSSQHIFGWKAKEVVEEARSKVSILLDTTPNCIIFTSGATEANNILLQGFCKKSLSDDPGKTPHILSTKIEHSSILQTIFELNKAKKATFTLLSNNKEGIVDPNEVYQIAKSICDLPLLFSIQFGNNEIVTIQPLAKIIDVSSNSNLFFHSDITQIIGKHPFSFKDMPVNAVSISGHKFHGPKGIGVLAFRDEKSMKCILPIYSGGSHESGLRPGTLSVPLIAGIGEASKLAKENIDTNKKLVDELTFKLYKGIKEKITSIVLLGPDIKSGMRLSGNLCLLIPEISGSKLCNELSNSIAFSTSSACSSQSGKTSHILSSIGLSEQDALSVVRLGVSHFNTRKEINSAALKIATKILEIKGS